MTNSNVKVNEYICPNVNVISLCHEDLDLHVVIYSR